MNPDYQQQPSTESVTIQIAHEVAEQKGIEPMELEPPLHSAINTDALDRLFASTKDGPRNGHVRFQYEGYTVHVASEGAIDVEVT